MLQCIYLLKTAKPKQPHQILASGTVCYCDFRTTGMVTLTIKTDASGRKFTPVAVSPN